MSLIETTGPAPTGSVSALSGGIYLDLPPADSQGLERVIAMIFVSTGIVWFIIKVGSIWWSLSTWVIRFPEGVWVGADSGPSVTYISSVARQVGVGSEVRMVRVALGARIVWFFQGSQIA